ncbi:MAG: hypothetical protein JSS68_15050 [Actinobacteria bacterium]|nr:hypothetical protein [Actinomycetota bacterium]
MIFLAIVCVLLVGVLLYREHAHAQQLAARDAQWDTERAGLLNRIQHPDVIPPVLPPQEQENVPIEQDDIHLVGTTQVTELNGYDHSD